jgi:Na+-translocating ferredoxin:NAD+ oxidoreductase RnfD subunit
MLLALLPGTAVLVWKGNPTIAYASLGAVGLAALSAMRGSDRDEHSSAFDRWVRASFMSVLGVLWLPPSLPWWAYAIAIVVALSVVRAFEGRIDRSPFHPAMIGCAIALVFATGAGIVPIGETASIAMAGACFIAGLALAVGRCIRWQMPLAVFIGSAATSVSWQVMALPPPAGDTLLTALPALVLTGFFVATDPSSSCVSSRARWVQSAGIGVLSELALLVLHDGTRMFIGMAGAALLMNAAAPWLDHLFRTPRAIRSAGAHGS